ncbi:MAG TPA: hypothetical protein VKG65_09135 [Terriglobales bacterium]|nr:hypothetical protein [Terriglobales bacterium]
MLKFVEKLWQRGRDLFPVAGYHFDRPLVLFESDDWGRVGLRDQEGLEQLRTAGLALGERPYDLYTLETTEDLAALRTVLKRHGDASGRHPCLTMNFILANLDFAKMSADAFRQIHLLPLPEGLPEGWSRAGLIEACRVGIAEGVFHPALHGTTHFSRSAAERALAGEGDRADFLRMLWRAGTPYIHWRMPWIGYEYWDPEKPEDERFLPEEAQRELIGRAVGAFAKLFSSLPRSACAPGYRANEDTYRAWAQHGIRVAQSGPDVPVPPYFDRHGVLHLTRTVEFEPGLNEVFSVEACLRQAEECFEQGVPAIVSVHSINFHSTVRDFRGPTLQSLDGFLTALEAKHPDLLYLHDEDLYELATTGAYRTGSGDVLSGAVRTNVTTKNFTRAGLARRQKT